MQRLELLQSHLQPRATVATNKMPVPPLTTHVLDTARGAPANGLGIKLEKLGSTGFEQLANGVTNDDGRLSEPLLAYGDARWTAGVYRITFDTAAYYARSNTETFYPEVAVLFEIKRPDEHYHVPLLTSPFGYSTYRGS